MKIKQFISCLFITLLILPLPIMAQITYAPTQPAPVTSILSARGQLTTTATVTGFAAQGAGRRSYVTEAICVNITSTVTAMNVLDGSTVLATIPCPVTSTNGAVTRFDPPLRGTANTIMGMALVVATTTTTYGGLIGFAATQ